MPELLKCEHLTEIRERDQQGKPIVYHRKCNKPASLRTIGGTLTTARAILCDQHAAQADFQTYTSTNGYARGKVDKQADLKFSQERLPGTGVQK